MVALWSGSLTSHLTTEKAQRTDLHQVMLIWAECTNISLQDPGGKLNEKGKTLKEVRSVSVCLCYLIARV